MGDPNLKADTARIRRCADDLKRVHDEFKNNAEPTRGYGVAELGSTLITSAFEEFADNWKAHRERLQEELAKLSDITAKAAETYDEVDSDLARALRGNDAGAKGGRT